MSLNRLVFEVVCVMGDEEEFTGELGRLYKFRSLDGPLGQRTAEDIILHNRLYWASPSSFNDPMDCRPNFIFGETPADRSRWIDQAIRNQLDHLPRSERQAAKTRLRKTPAEEHRRNFVRSFDSFMSESAVCCFSTTASNVLLWGHYGACHRGACFVFEECLSPDPFLGYEVTYSTTRPVVNALSFGENIDAMKSSILTKASDWSY